LEREKHCGLPTEDIRCFCQGTVPAVDRGTGRILLETPHSLALSPDGHGGMLPALARSGCLDEIRRRGICLVFYGQVDNPLLQICDPALLGYHLLAGSEMTTQVVAKRHALEPVGNVVEIDGQTRIIEYSDLPEQVAKRASDSGDLLLWAGNMAVHVFSVDFLTRQVGNAKSLPIHRALKKVAYVDGSGRQVQPSTPNAIKFERFIFDLLPQAKTALVVEADPAEAFAPVKNATGAAADTPETARAAMIERDRRLLRQAGVDCAPDVAVEINPLWAYDVAEIRHKLPANFRVSAPTYFSLD
jgi:UDP-N-acetylglucosamine/UDP-N-acetylgalactosamine diphosphorylase